MRITDSISYRNFLESSESLNTRLAAASLQVSSGKRLGSLQDGPGDSAELVSLRDQLDRLDQYQASADRSRYFLSVSDSTLDSVQSLYTSIFTKASLAATGSSDAAARASLASEVRGLR